MRLVADNIRITRAKIHGALAGKDPEPVKDLARRCVKAGAQALDLNTGPLKKDPEGAMAFFVEAVESVTDLPLVLDTTNPAAMAEGLATAKNPVILNGISLEPVKLRQILPLARDSKADLVGYLLYPDSRVPRETFERLALALELVAAVEQAGIPKERLILDPVVPPLSWDDSLDRARGTIETLRLLPETLGFEVRTMAGLSNLTSGAADPARKTVMETVYLSMLASAGLDYLLMDILNPVTMAAARAATVLAAEQIFSWAQIPGPACLARP